MAPQPIKITESIACIECGYDLLGLSNDGDCPECGTPIVRSMHDRMLRFEPVPWLTRVASGMRIWHGAISAILLLPVVGIFVLIAAIVLEQIRDPLFSTRIDRIIGDVLGYSLFGALALANVMYLRGFWLITTPKTGGISELGPIREPARWLAFIAVALGWFSLVSDNLGLIPIAAYIIDGAVIVAVSAHVWTCGRIAELLSGLVPRMTRKQRKRLRLARRDGWVVATLCALILALGGENIIAFALWLYFVTTHSAFEGLMDALRLELSIARELQTGESSQPQTA